MAVDNVNNPNHYAGGTSFECIELMEITLGKKAVYYFCMCNGFKYLWRYKLKNGLEDLNKAEWYLNRVINRYSKGSFVKKKHIDIVNGLRKFADDSKDEYM